MPAENPTCGRFACIKAPITHPIMLMKNICGFLRAQSLFCLPGKGSRAAFTGRSEKNMAKSQ
ncbi:MAG: hypothetical protein DU429_03740 [Candidatus Tokpelaia sp.]|nr:MAG: hypothetical protein DU430_01605 [Candidatus Tokpelaia sp.]KAA6207209.1 MAG: hypothetical protein DU429_03740 [Candidatus Tokpelaia sp.]KAA6406236.1 hypothetical protein DPQ22_00525 [Candidatus Tokpelaia sp.]